MAQSNVIVRLSLKDADAVQRGLVALGADGEKALKRIEAAGRTPSAGLKALGAASDEVKEKLGGLASQGGVLGTALQKLGPSGLLAAAGLGAIVAASAVVIQRAAEITEHFGQIEDAAERVGASAENLQVLRDVFQDNASSADELNGALEKLHAVMGAALSGNAEAVASFARAGITLDDLRAAGGDATVVLDLLSGKLAGAGDSGQQAAIAVDLLGKSAKGLVPALTALGGNLDALREKGLKDGTIAADATTQALAALDDKAKKLDDRFKALGAGGALDVQKALTDVRQLLYDTEAAFLRVAESNAGFWHKLFSSPEQLSSEADLADQMDFAAKKRAEIQRQATADAQQRASLTTAQTGIEADLSSNATTEERIAKVNALLHERLGLIDAMRTKDGANAAAFSETEERAREAARRAIAEINAPGEQKAAAERERIAHEAEAADKARVQAAIAAERQASSDRVAALKAAGQDQLAIEEELAQRRRDIAREAIDPQQQADLVRGAVQRAGAEERAAMLDEEAKRAQLQQAIVEARARIDDQLESERIEKLKQAGEQRQAADLALRGATRTIREGAGDPEQQEQLLANARLRIERELRDALTREDDAIGSARAEAARRSGNTIEAVEIEHQQRLQQIRDSSYSTGTKTALTQLEDEKNARLMSDAEQTRFSDWLRAQPKDIQDVASAFGDLGSSAADAFSQAIINGGKLSDVLMGLALDLQKVLLRMAMMKLIEVGANAAFGAAAGSGTANAADNSSVSTFAAHGAVFDHGSVVPFARGGIVDRPTLFPMARGAGLMGEAGPEAVVPLRRTKSGDLGVVAGGGAPQVTVNVINNAGAKVTTEEKKDDRGGVRIDVMVDAIEQAMANRATRPGSTLNRALTQAANPIRAR